VVSSISDELLNAILEKKSFKGVFTKISETDKEKINKGINTSKDEIFELVDNTCEIKKPLSIDINTIMNIRSIINQVFWRICILRL